MYASKSRRRGGVVVVEKQKEPEDICISFVETQKTFQYFGSYINARQQKIIFHLLCSSQFNFESQLEHIKTQCEETFGNWETYPIFLHVRGTVYPHKDDLSIRYDYSCTLFTMAQTAESGPVWIENFPSIPEFFKQYRNTDIGNDWMFEGFAVSSHINFTPGATKIPRFELNFITETRVDAGNSEKIATKMLKTRGSDVWNYNWNLFAFSGKTGNLYVPLAKQNENVLIGIKDILWSWGNNMWRVCNPEEVTTFTLDHYMDECHIGN